MNASNVALLKQSFLQALESRQLLDATVDTMSDAQQEAGNQLPGVDFEVSDYFDYQERWEQVQAIPEANVKPAVVTAAVELVGHGLTGLALYKVGGKMGGHGKALVIAGGAAAIAGFDLEAQGVKAVYDGCNSWEQQEVVDAVINWGNSGVNTFKWGVSTSFNKVIEGGTAVIDFVYQTVGTSDEVAQQADGVWSTVTGLTVVDYIKNAHYTTTWPST